VVGLPAGEIAARVRARELWARVRAGELPALVLPAGNRPEGLPLAVQLAGPGGGKARLVWIAGELERRLPRRRYAAVFYPTASSAPAPV
jgi:amidase